MMKTGLLFVKLQIKKFIKKIPVIVLESLVFLLLLLVFGKYAAGALYGDEAVRRMKIGVVSGEDAQMTSLLLSFVGEMESFEESILFEQMEEEQANKAVADGEIYAAVFLQEGVLEGILNGTNTPAKIVLGHAYSQMETALFEEVAQAGNRLLSVAQAGIYAADEFCINNGHEEVIEEAEMQLNRAYLEYALGRDSVFKMQEVNAMGKASPVAYYSISLVLVFLSFAGMMLGRYIAAKRNAFSELFAAKGLPFSAQYFAESVAFSGVFMLLGLVFLGPALIFAMYTENRMNLSIAGMIFLFFSIFVMGTFLHLLTGMLGNEAGGLGIGLGVQFLMVYAGGLLLPSAFLPKAVESIGKYLPHTIWFQSVLAILNGQSFSESAGKLVLIFLISILLGMLLFAGKNVRGRMHFYAGTGHLEMEGSACGLKCSFGAVPVTLGKQYMIKHKIWYLLLLFMLPFLFVAGHKEQSELSGLEIGICMQDEDGERLAKRLTKEEGILRFVTYEDEQEMLRDVENGALECAYLLEEGFFEKLSEGKKNRLIELYYSPASSAYKLSYEVVYSHLFGMLSEEILSDWYQESVMQKEGGMQELLSLKEKYETNGSTFTFAYEHEGKEQSRQDTVLDSVRGSIATMLFLLLLLGIGNIREIYERFSRVSKSFAGRLCAYSFLCAILGTVVSGLLLLVVSGRIQPENVGTEILALLVLAGLTAVMGLVFLLILRTAERFYAILPMLLFATLLFCPVFIQLKTYVPILAFVEKIFPVSQYLYFFM